MYSHLDLYSFTFVLSIDLITKYISIALVLLATNWDTSWIIQKYTQGSEKINKANIHKCIWHLEGTKFDARIRWYFTSWFCRTHSNNQSQWIFRDQECASGKFFSSLGS